MKWWKYVGHQWKISTDQQDIFYWENICKNRHTGCLVCWNLFKAMNDTNNKVNKKKNRIPNYCFTWNLHVRVLSFPQLKKIMQVLVNRSVCKNNKQQFAHLPVDLVFFIDFLFISTKFNFKLFFYILSSFFLVFQGLLPLFGDGGSDGCFPFQHQQPEKKKLQKNKTVGHFSTKHCQHYCLYSVRWAVVMTVGVSVRYQNMITSLGWRFGLFLLCVSLDWFGVAWFRLD